MENLKIVELDAHVAESVNGGSVVKDAVKRMIEGLLGNTNLPPCFYVLF